MQRELRFHAGRAQHRVRHHGDAGAGGGARDDRVVGAILHHALGDHARAPEPGFEPAPVGAAGGEGEDGAAGEVLRLGTRGWFGRDQHQLLDEHGPRLRLRATNGSAMKRHRARRAAPWRRARRWCRWRARAAPPGAPCGSGRGPRQARRRSAFERAELQRAVRRAAFHRGLRLARKPQQALGVAEQHLAFGGQHQPAPLAVEKRRAEARLELLHARGDVGLHAVERRRRPQDAALLGDRLEDPQLGQFHVHERRMNGSLLFISQEDCVNLH